MPRISVLARTSQRARRLGLFAHRCARAQRVNDADGREVQALQDGLGVEVGHQFRRPLRGQHPVRHAPGGGGRRAAAQLLAPGVGAGDLDAAALGEDARVPCTGGCCPR